MSKKRVYVISAVSNQLITFIELKDESRGLFGHLYEKYLVNDFSRRGRSGLAFGNFSKRNIANHIPLRRGDGKVLDVNIEVAYYFWFNLH